MGIRSPGTQIHEKNFNILSNFSNFEFKNFSKSNYFFFHNYLIFDYFPKILTDSFCKKFSLPTFLINYLFSCDYFFNFRFQPIASALFCSFLIVLSILIFLSLIFFSNFLFSIILLFFHVFLCLFLLFYQFSIFLLLLIICFY